MLNPLGTMVASGDVSPNMLDQEPAIMLAPSSFVLVEDLHPQALFVFGTGLLAHARAHVCAGNHCVIIPSFGVGQAGLHTGVDGTSRESLSGNRTSVTLPIPLQPTFSVLGNLRRRLIFRSLAADQTRSDVPWSASDL